MKTENAFLLVSLLSAVTYVFTYQTNEPGFNNVGLAVFAAVSAAVFVFTAWRQQTLRHPYALALLIPISVLLFDALFYANDIVGTLAPLAIYLLLTLLVLASTSQQAIVNPFTSKLFGLLNMLGAVGNAISVFIARLKQLFFPPQSQHQLARRIGFGLLFSLPILLVFALLFAEADALFANALHQIISAEALVDQASLWLRTLFFFGIMSVLLLLSIGSENEESDKPLTIKKHDTLILSVVLILLNGLFAAFNFFQIKYVLLGNQTAEFFQQNDLTYADYVHQGFFQLVFACALVGTIIMAFSMFAQRSGKKALFYTVQLLLIAQTFIIASSALKRLWLYQEAYGFTVLRLHVQWFMWFLMAVLVLGFIAATLHKWKWYSRLVFIPALAAFCLVLSINTEAMVARQNIERWQNGERLDVPYLLTFSSDALDEIAGLRQSSLPAEDRAAIERYIEALLARHEQQKEISGWRYFDWRTDKFLRK